MNDAQPTGHDANPLATAREVALSFLDRRMYSRWELERRLRHRRFAPDVIERVLDELEAAGYVDDRAFARAFVSDRIRLAPRGYLLVIQELRARGVDRETASEAVRSIEDEHSELAVARDFLASRARRLAGLDPEVARRRTMTWLRGRGFRTETIFRVVDEADREVR